WVLTVLLIGATGFAFVRTHNHVRELEASRDALQARLNQTTSGLQFLSQKVDAWEPPPPAPAAPVQPARATPAAPPAHRKHTVAPRPSLAPRGHRVPPVPQVTDRRRTRRPT